jgi:hypothetical protein
MVDGCLRVADLNVRDGPRVGHGVSGIGCSRVGEFLDDPVLMGC